MISVTNLKFCPGMNYSRVRTRNQILVWSRNWSGTEWKTNSKSLYGTNKQKKKHAKVYIKQFLLCCRRLRKRVEFVCVHFLFRFSSFCLQEVTMTQKYLKLDFSEFRGRGRNYSYNPRILSSFLESPICSAWLGRFGNDVTSKLQLCSKLETAWKARWALQFYCSVVVVGIISSNQQQQHEAT